VERAHAPQQLRPYRFLEKLDGCLKSGPSETAQVTFGFCGIALCLLRKKIE